MDTPRQTLTYIQDLLKSHRLMPKAKMGQNFLIDLNLIDVILEAAELTEQDSVLEVGTGTGSLSAKMAAHAGSLLTVELDPDFYQLASDLLRHRKNVRIFHGDILAGKNKLNPEVLSFWDDLSKEKQCTKRKLIANLPYVVATPVIANLLLSEIVLEKMIVMIQWEVAQRLVAPVGDKSYGALSILVQSVADVKILRHLPPAVFWPQPKVDSAIVAIYPNATKRAMVPDVAVFRAFLRDLYTQRRKNLRSALSGWPSGRREKSFVDKELARLGIDGTGRAEALDLETHLRLCSVFGTQAKEEGMEGEIL